MEKFNTNQRTFLRLAAAAALPLLLVLFLNINAQKVESLSTATIPAEIEGCNATRIADCLAAADDDEEFMMESETSRRILAGGGKTISPGAVNPTKTFCDKNAFGSCISRPNKFYDNRTCNYQNTCARDTR